MPLVSVVLPVFNAGSLVGAAIDSVLRQTLTDLELIVVDDGSTDDTRAVLGRYQDRRLRVLGFKSNRGVVHALNFGVAAATSTYIARLDADDRAMPNRLRRQMDLLQSDESIGLVFSGWRWLDHSGARSRGIVAPSTSHAALRLGLHFGNPIVHSSVVFHRQRWLDAGGYMQQDWPAEDYGLWVRMSRMCQVHAVPEALVLMNHSKGGISAQHATSQLAAVSRIASDALSDLLGDRVPHTTLLPILTSRFSSCPQLSSSERLVVRASQAVVRECSTRNIDASGVHAATARLLYGMRYRTRDGKRCARLLATLPMREPRLAIHLIRAHGRWLRRGYA